MTGKTRHLGVFSRQNRVFSRHKQMSSPSGYPEGLDLNFTRQMTGKTRHFGVFSRQNRVFPVTNKCPRGTGREIYPSIVRKKTRHLRFLSKTQLKIWVFSRHHRQMSSPSGLLVLVLSHIKLHDEDPQLK